MASTSRRRVLVWDSPGTTLDLLTGRLLGWWPREYTWAESAPETLVTEARATQFHVKSTGPAAWASFELGNRAQFHVMPNPGPPRG